MFIQGILPAAGYGRRCGGNKLCRKLPSGDILALVAARTLAQGCDALTVVIRADDFILQKFLEEAGFSCLPCSDSIHGMGHSIACGVAATAYVDAWLIMPADMPALKTSSVKAVSAALRAGAPLAAAFYEGRRGHPVGFQRRFRQALENLRGDQGARHLLMREQAALIRVECNDPGVLLDVDTPEDWAKLSGHTPYIP